MASVLSSRCCSFHGKVDTSHQLTPRMCGKQQALFICRDRDTLFRLDPASGAIMTDENVINSKKNKEDGELKNQGSKHR